MNGISIGEALVNNAVDSEYNNLPNVDAKYGPYASTAEALSTLAQSIRAIGLTVGIKTSRGIEEYWFKNGILNANLVKKGGISSDEAKVIVDDAVADKVAKTLVISSTENKAGSYNVNGDDVDIYEKSVTLLDLPIVQDTTKEYVISSEPLGFGLYMNVDSFIASSGKGLAKEFFNFNYEITRCYINANLESVIVVKCKNAVSENVNGLLHIQYCKFYGDILEFNVTIPESVDKEAITLEMPKLKFNKKLVFSYITDDSYSIFQYIFSFINKRYIAKTFKLPDGRSIFWHLGMQGNPSLEQYVHDAYYPDSFMQCTDGAGIKRRYATSVAVWGDKLKDKTIGQDVGFHYPWISEKEFKFFKDFGFTINYHDLNGYDGTLTDTQDKFDKCVEDTLALIKEATDYTPKIMIEPNGDHDYIGFSQGNSKIQAIISQTGDDRIKKVYPFTPEFTLDKQDVTIQRLFAYGTDLSDTNDNPQYATDLLNILSDFNSVTDLSTIYWLIGAAHKSSHWESVLIKSIHELYGDSALDNLWFPTIDEFYEYYVVKKTTLINKQVTTNGIKVKLYIPKNANFYFNDLSILVNGISSITGVTVTSGTNVYGTSYAINDGKLLVNLNYNPDLITRTEKYVSLFENNPNAEYAYDNAYYFVQQLKAGIKEPYLARLNALISPPTLATAIISGGDTTYSQDVNVALTYSGTVPTEYMLSESAAFVGATWLPFTANPAFHLSDGYGVKTVYAKIKNNYGESNVISDTIKFISYPLELTSIDINNGASSTNLSTITVSFNYLGVATHYMLSEDPNFTNAIWVTFTQNALFELSAGYGTKIVYGKLKNDSEESASTSDIITVVDTSTAVLNGISINNGDKYAGSTTVNVTFDTQNAITKYRLATESENIAIKPWVNWTGSTVSYNTGASATDGQLLVVKAQVANDTTESDIKQDDIFYQAPVGLSSIILGNENQMTFEGTNVPVTFNAVNTPTQYRLAESAVLLATAAWIDYTESISYQFDSTGNKTLYGQLKNDTSISDVVSGDIELIEPVVTILIANVPTNAGANIEGAGFVNSISSGDRPADLKDTQGNKVGIKVGKYEPYNTAAYSFIRNKYSITLNMGLGNPAYWKQPILSGVGKYPNELIWNSEGTKDVITPIISSNPTGTYAGVILKDLVPGNYQVNLLLSDNNINSSTTVLPWAIRVQDQIQNISNDTDINTKIINNNSVWLNYNVTVDEDGYMFIGSAFVGDTTGYVTYYRVSPICIYEIKKV